jgi:hypothetical protein
MLALGVGVRHMSKGCGRDTGLNFLWLKSVKAQYCGNCGGKVVLLRMLEALQGVHYVFLICKNLSLL